MTSAPKDPSYAALREEGENTYTVREVVALFESEKALHEAILSLEENGVDRARISVLGASKSGDAHANRPDWVRKLADSDDAPHAAPVEEGEMAEAKAAVIAVPGYIGAAAGLIAVMASGGALAPAIGLAIAGGALGGGAGFAASRLIGKHHREHVTKQLQAGGLVLWVMVDDDEDKLSQLLESSGGTSVHVTEHEMKWGVEEMPLALTQVDPFLES